MIGRYSPFLGDFYDNLSRVQREMEQMLGAGAAPASLRAVGGSRFPAVNLGVSPEAVEVYAFLPGIDPAALELSVHQGLLVIAGQRPPAIPDGATDVYQQERFSGEFRRTLSLPEDVDPERIEATYRDGVLHVRAHKRAVARPRRVQVK